MDDGDGCAKTWVHLVPLSYTVKYGYNSVSCFPTIFKNSDKKPFDKHMINTIINHRKESFKTCLYIYIYITESLCCIAEVNTPL